MGVKTALDIVAMSIIVLYAQEFGTTILMRLVIWNVQNISPFICSSHKQLGLLVISLTNTYICR